MDWNIFLLVIELVTDVVRLVEFGFRITILATLVVVPVTLIGYWMSVRATRPGKTKHGCPIVSTADSNGRYIHVGSCASGDLCDVMFAEDSRGQRYLMKAARRRASNHWLQHEQQVLRSLCRARQSHHYRAYLPWLVDQQFVRGRCTNVFEFREGFMSAQQILQHYPRGLDGRHLAWMYKRVLEVLGFIHDNGWIHGAVLPQHLMFHVENHGLQLVGWCQSVPTTTRLRMICKSFANWYPPEVQQHAATTESTDIVLATRSMIHLAGGNPAAGWIPAHVPVAIQRFWKSCLYESPAMRPQDAWQLHEEFTDLLEVVYGPPRYHNLSLINKGECNGWNSLV